MGLEDTMLSKSSQTEKDKFHMGALWVWLCPAGGSLHGLTQSLAPSRPQREPRRRVTFLPGPMGATEGVGRGMIQPGGLGGSGEEGSEKGRTKAEGFLGPGEE